MKVILLKDVAKIGLKGEVVVVPDGFALNKLIPKGLAGAATPENLKKIAHISATSAHNKEIEINAFSTLLKSLEGKEVTIEVDANAEGTMFQGLKADGIAKAISEAGEGTLDASHVLLEHPIKTLGSHQIEVVSGATKGEVTIILVAKSK